MKLMRSVSYHATADAGHLRPGHGHSDGERAIATRYHMPVAS